MTTEVDEVTKEHMEAELTVAFQNANTQFMYLTQSLVSSLNMAVAAYAMKQAELIRDCQTIEEVHEVLGIPQVVGYRCPKGE